MTSPFDSYRPPEPPRRKRRRDRLVDGVKDVARRGGGMRRRGADSGAREMPMVPDVEFSSYYGRQIVKAPPWEWPIGAYLVLGGMAGGSAIIASGAQLSDNKILARNSRLAAIGAAGLGSLALVKDLGRPARFLNMMRVFKLSSPLSVGSWILASFGTVGGASAAAEVYRILEDNMGLDLPFPDPIERLIHWAKRPATLFSGLFGAPLAVYTAVLLGDTANPTWNAAKDHLPFVFVSSASLASGGLAMITTDLEHVKPARVMAVAGVVGDVVAMKLMENSMDPTAAEPLHQGGPGKLLKASEALVIAGGIGAVLGRKSRVLSALSGAALIAGSACTRFGILNAGIEAAKDPRYTVEPQKRRLAAREGRDNVTTAG